MSHEENKNQDSNKKTPTFYFNALLTIVSGLGIIMLTSIWNNFFNNFASAKEYNAMDKRVIILEENYKHIKASLERIEEKL